MAIYRVQVFAGPGLEIFEEYVSSGFADDEDVISRRVRKHLDEVADPKIYYRVSVDEISPIEITTALERLNTRIR